MISKYSILEDTVRDLFVRVVWTHKIQEKQADIYQKQFKNMETISIVCTSLTSIGILSTIFNEQLWIKIVSAILSFTSFFVSAYFKSFDLNILSKTHKESANKLLIIRNEITSLLTSIRIQELSINELEEKYCELMDKANTIFEDAPITTDKAVKLARKALQVTGDNFFTNSEIDSYLPESLRKGG